MASTTPIAILSSLYYRPQRSWGKVIFSEACVKNSVHIWEQCMLGDTGNKQPVRVLLECILLTKVHRPRSGTTKPEGNSINLNY